MYYLIKYGYEGTMFSGFQRGNGSNSVEDSVIRVLEKYGISSNMESAARTDRYVSARGNVLLLDTEKNIADVMGILNSKIRYMFFYSYSELNGYMNPRHNSMKKYSYIITDKIDIDALMETLSEFITRNRTNATSKVDLKLPRNIYSELEEEVNKGDAISVNDLIRFILREYAKGKTKN